jgi:hypothetical protein
MRLWSLHPKYLDAQGLVALWREGLLARAVLRGQTQGYRHHPQLERFRSQSAPLRAINAYLGAIHAESLRRGYSFDRSKIGPLPHVPMRIPVSLGQLQYEWRHLLRKLAARDPVLHDRLRDVEEAPRPHPLFRVRAGAIESWERPEGGV